MRKNDATIRRPQRQPEFTVLTSYPNKLHPLTTWHHSSPAILVTRFMTRTLLPVNPNGADSATSLYIGSRQHLTTDAWISPVPLITSHKQSRKHDHQIFQRSGYNQSRIFLTVLITLVRILHRIRSQCGFKSY